MVKRERPQRKCAVTKPVPGTLQEGGAPFETTHWTVVLQASKPDSDEAARKALATFSEAYWPPLYTFVRRRGYSPADAQDLIQGFFVHLFEHNTLSRADQEKGRLRTFLLGSMQNFLLKERERMRAIKRGGNHQFVSFDLDLPQAEAAMYATAHLSDVNAYDVAWASAIVTRAWKNVRERFAAEGKREWVDELRPFVAGGTDGSTEPGRGREATGDIGRDFARVAYTPAATISQRVTRRGGEHSLQSRRDRC